SSPPGTWRCTPSRSAPGPTERRSQGRQVRRRKRRHQGQSNGSTWHPPRYRALMRSVSSRSSVLETVRNLAAAFGELGHDLLVQPDVHFRRAVERALVAKLLRQLLARAETAVEVEQLHQVDDRLFPVQFFTLAVGDLLYHHLDFRPGHWLPRAGCRGWRGRRRRRGR